MTSSRSSGSCSPRSGWRRLLAIPTPVIVLFSLVIAAVVLWRQGSIASLGVVGSRLSTREMLTLLGVYSLGPILQCLRWDGLIRMVRGSSSRLAAADVFLTSVILNYAAPIGLAVPARTALTARDLGLTLGGSGAVVVWESVLDLGVLAVFSLIWLTLGDIDALRAVLPSSQNSVWIVAGAGVVFLLLAVAVLTKRPAWRQKLVRTGIDLAMYPAKRPGAFAVVVACTLGFWVVQLFVMRLLLGAIGIEPSWLLVFGLLGLPVLIGMLSPLPGGAGVREALMVTVAGVEGVDAAAVLFAAVAYRAALFLIVPVLYGCLRLVRRFRPAAPVVLVEQAEILGDPDDRGAGNASIPG